ncbi:UbiH/UbiF family hydroxylase [Oryzicola mucosus]|uniref:UbiH/UbiF family hydroxylase n=1 Tax=Oryzicola mucosus TaxID=2767425 RepID=A0A8J6U5K4_9HYPH|nr:UbiH/UbiF family hydroxylase [Oryzicola mucosus]MBD0416425.1 UbiH/UbiF family hydroxylase [Oryzicola mucosus]
MTEATTSAATVLVAGTGPAGMIAALGFAQAGFEVVMVGPPVLSDDDRTTALMAPALDYLDGLGVLEPLRDMSAPLRTMRIVDGTARLLRSPVVTFHASEIDELQFGMNFPNRALNAALEQAVAAHAGIAWRKCLVKSWSPREDEVVVQLTDGTEVHARLAVAADGRKSPAREAAGISVVSQAHRQSALVLSFSHSRDHAFTSTEFHTETGPFTQVPLPGRRSSLVWVVRPETAEELNALDDTSLSRIVEERMQSMLGRVTVDGGRQIYPLSTAVPTRFAAKRIMLVGEAAHVFPPIGAQGLNLGIRDVQQAIDAALKNQYDPGLPSSLVAYDAARRPDIVARTGAVSLLNLSLLSDMLPSQLARTAGLSLLGAVSPLRTLFMREGLRPGSGFSKVFQALRPDVLASRDARALRKQVRDQHAMHDHVEQPR